MFRSTVVSAALAGASLFGLAATALAADLTITGTRNTPVTTSNANSGAGNVTVDGTLDVPNGTAITVDSNNSVTVNATRVVRSSAESNGIGVDIVAPAGGLAGTITNNGQINVTGTGANNAVGSNNVGLRIGGTGTFTGNIVSRSGSFSVGGTDSQGISVVSRLAGNLGVGSVAANGARSTAVDIGGEVAGQITIDGALSAIGADGTGLAIRGRVTGTIINGGSISVGTAETLGANNTVIPAVAGRAGVLISGQADGGFVNDRFFVDANGVRVPPAQVDATRDRLVTGTIGTNGGTPAILVSPGAAATADAVVGNVGTGDDAFGIVNRAGIASVSGSAGRNVDAVRVVGGNGFLARTGGGITNQVNGSIRAGGLDADAAGIRVGVGGVATEIRNAGRIEVLTDRTSTTTNGTTTTGPGGFAYGIRVDAGGDVDQITNSGAILATATGDNRAAIGIYDAGGLQTLTNSGSIRAVAGLGNNVGTIAIDTSANANGLTFNNSGTIEGRVNLGAGSDVLNMSGGTISGPIAFGAGSNQINLSGGRLSSVLSATGGTMAAALSGSGILDFTGQDGASFVSFSAVGDSRVVFDIGTNFTGLNVAGAASFNGASRIDLNVRDLLSGTQTVTLVTAAGGFATDHLASLVDTANAPFIFAVSNVAADATTLSLTLRRKTGAELGLTDAYGQVYEASIAALASEQGLTSAVNALRDQAAVAAAVRELTPTTFGSGSARVIVASQDAGYGVLARRLETLRLSFVGAGSTIGADRPDFGLWVQQTGNFFSRADRDDDPGFDGNSYGVAGGGDFVFGSNAALGIGLGYISSEVDPDGLTKSPLVVNDLSADLYGTARFGNFFVEATAGYANNDYRSRRVVTFGGLVRTAEGDFSGSRISGNLTVGYEFRTGRFIIVPSTTVNALHVKQDGYTEDGAGALNLDIESLSFDLVRNTTRVGIGYAIPFGDGELRIDAHGAIINRISGDSTLTTTGRFVVGGPAFHLETKSAAASGWRAGTAATYIGGRTAFGVGYDREHSKGYDNNALTMSLGMHF